MFKKFLTDINIIRSAIDTNKLVVFAGAGVSIDSGVPGWGSLIDDIKSEIGIPDNEDDYLRIAQMYYNERQQKEFVDKVRSVQKHKKTRYNEIHDEIFQLGPAHVLTTNFDDLLEQVIKKRSLPFSVVSKDKEFPYALNTNLLVKIHGDLDDTDIVLKEDDYINYSANHPLIEAFLKSVFASKVVMFVGYSFSDIDLKMILQTVRNILGNDFQNAYLLSVDENLHHSQRTYLKNKGINVVNYFDALNKKNENYIVEYLNGNNALNEVYFKKGESLSVKGQNLLNFLTFISSYDKFNEPLTNKNIIDQIYLSLNRFSELSTLPPDFVANLYPFNTSSQYVHNYERYSLLTKNNTLCELFFDQIEYENNEVKFKPTADSNLSENSISEYENKLKEIIRKLNLSLIYYLFKEGEKPDSLGYKGWSDKYQKLQVKIDSPCTCLNCQFSRLDLAGVITETLSSDINETTNIHSDLQLAYFQYKIGNFNQAWRFFEEVANKAWQSGKYFSYYIAKHNIKTLRNLLRAYEFGLKKEEKKKIIKEMNDIDFDKLLSQVQFLGKSEYELLKSIRDDAILKKAEDGINDAYDKILEAYDGYKEGGKTILGPFYAQRVEIELNKIVSFYTNNFIVADYFSDFKKVCMKAIEAFLISFATSDEYGEKLKEFNKLFFDIVVLYGNAKEIKEITRKYRINDLLFNELDFPGILDTANNFLKSFFEKNILFSSTTHHVEIMRSQIENNFFGEKCRGIFQNIFVIFSGVEIKKESAGDLIFNLIEFLNHETFLYQNEIDSLCSFMYKNYALFSEQNIEKLLQTSIRKIRIYVESAFFRALTFVQDKNNFIKISNKDLIFSILTYSESSFRKKDAIISLWSLSNDMIKAEIKQKIIDSLNNKFDVELYSAASYSSLIDYNLYFEKYVTEIDRIKGNGLYTLVCKRPRLNSFDFINAMIFMYKIGISSDDYRLKAFSNLTDYMEFYLFPEQFDYNKFKVEWLFIGDSEIFYNRFKKIHEIKDAIEYSLSIEFDIELAEIYAKYFICKV